jgi:hypothetical protein
MTSSKASDKDYYIVCALRQDYFLMALAQSLIFLQLRRHEVTICNYEASANPADHRVHQVTPQTHFIS